MELTKMKAKSLKQWIIRLEMSLKLETDPYNIKLYNKWLADARAEQRARMERQKAWWDCKEKGMFGG